MTITSLGKRNDPNLQRREVDGTTVARDGRKATEIRRRASLLKSLIEKMYFRETATEREIRAAVTQDEWARYEDAKNSAKRPKMPPFIRQQFSHYNALLRSADRRFDGAENSSGSRMRAGNKYVPDYKNPYRLAERDYEQALEVLQDLLHCEPRAVAFLDRPVSFGLDNAPNPDQESVPRLITARSPHRLQGDQCWQSNKDLRLSTLLDSRNKLIATGFCNMEEM